MRNYLNGVFQRISGNDRFLVRFQDGCEKDLTSNQLTIVIVEKSPVDKEPKVTTITEIPDEKFPLEKGYYHSVYVMLHFNKEDGVYLMTILIPSPPSKICGISLTRGKEFRKYFTKLFKSEEE